MSKFMCLTTALAVLASCTSASLEGPPRGHGENGLFQQDRTKVNINTWKWEDYQAACMVKTERLLDVDPKSWVKQLEFGHLATFTETRGFCPMVDGKWIPKTRHGEPNDNGVYIYSGGVKRVDVEKFDKDYEEHRPDYISLFKDDLDKKDPFDPLDPRLSSVYNHDFSNLCSPEELSKVGTWDRNQCVNRKSFMGNYKVDPVTGRPINPCGRTGLAGMGSLFHWGVNYAVDMVMTRWSPDETGRLQVLAILRKDCDCWAVPGGFIEPGDTIGSTLVKEFHEEAFNEDKSIDTQILANELSSYNDKLCVYAGYADDRRNTDNSWIEAVAVNYHLTGETFTHQGMAIQFTAGSDARAAKWMDVEKDMVFYGGHKLYVEEIAKSRKAKW